MKKVLLFAGVAIVFPVLGAMLDMALGIQYPNMIASIIHKVFYSINGMAIFLVLALPGKKPRWWF